ncbi:MAG: HD-GYP domain-containing protein [Firmicutes bacterium]|nr:HD-GYP domain-containing protein [Bacillota bacterium]
MITINELLYKAIALKDKYLEMHHENVCFYSTTLALIMNLPNDVCEAIRHASLLHDIGKIGIPNNILFKQGKLTPKEWEVMKLHPAIGAELLINGDKKLGIYNLSEVVKVIYHHHERWDGNGYPNGLKGEQIPIGARVIAVADAFDAMTTNRSYRGSLSVNAAIEELKRCANTQFDGKIVETFVEIINEKEYLKYDILLSLKQPSSCLI